MSHVRFVQYALFKQQSVSRHILRLFSGWFALTFTCLDVLPNPINEHFDPGVHSGNVVQGTTLTSAHLVKNIINQCSRLFEWDP